MIIFEEQSAEWKELFFILFHSQLLNDELVKHDSKWALTPLEIEGLVAWDKLESMATKAQ